ncbi:hypothetical protein K474DRAFT_1658962 [Panus rudis PR-1116 ss-1]|nr:hypothetical protein K474DRAFT_1658962 [Panus rudis PR-1116 ss-1]
MSGKNPGNQARGFKAAISNPNNSEEAKEHAQQALNELEESGAINSAEARNGQVERGHKANLSNPNTSEDSKEHSKKVLNEL